MGAIPTTSTIKEGWPGISGILSVEMGFAEDPCQRWFQHFLYDGGDIGSTTPEGITIGLRGDSRKRSNTITANDNMANTGETFALAA